MDGGKERRIMRCAIAGALLLVLGLPQPAAAQKSENVIEGARVYGDMCGRCHNPRSPLERNDRDWVTIINHMRVRANMTGEQVWAVLAFLEATNTDPRERTTLPASIPPASERVGAEAAAKGAPPSTDPRLIAEGRELVAQGACLGCHVIGKEGGLVGPSLNGVVQRRGPAFVRQKLADPTFDNATSMMPNFGLTSDDIEAIVAFLATPNSK